MRKLLFVTWDGPQVSYLEGLFFPILAGLVQEFDIHVIQFTWGDLAKSNAVKSTLEAKGFQYTRMEVGPRRPVALGNALTLIKGMFFLRSYLRTKTIDVVLFRSTYPGLMSFPFLGRKRRWVFDTDGLPIDEKLDIGRLKPGSLSFRLMKWAEAGIVRKSDRVLLRSNKARYALPEVAKPSHYSVVGNGRDPELYTIPDTEHRHALRARLGVSPQDCLLVYCGSLGPQYCLQEMMDIMVQVNQAYPVKMLILTGDPEFLQKQYIDPLISDRLICLTLPAMEVPAYLGASDIGLAIRQPYPSMSAVSPLKLGEYLLCGLPVIASAGIGDTEELISGSPACFVLKDHSSMSLIQASDWVKKVMHQGSLQAEARALGMQHFSLDQSILSYKSALGEL
jgi:glycosyltransferase involved in cell wall biosynthesis